MRPWVAQITAFAVAAVLFLQRDSAVAIKAEHGHPRALQATRARLSAERLKSLGVPEDADILFQLTSDCPQELDPAVLARMGQLCFIIKNIRSCLNISQDAPQFVFKGCTKKSGCLPSVFDADETACILQGIGIAVSQEGECVDCRCRIPAGNDILFVEKQGASFERVANVPDSTCFVAQPKRSNFTVQTVCTNGRPTTVNRWTFKFPKKASDEPYDCILSRRCLEGFVDEVTLCYRNGTGGDVKALDSSETSARGAGGREIPNLVSYSLPSFLMLGFTIWLS